MKPNTYPKAGKCWHFRCSCTRLQNSIPLLIPSTCTAKPHPAGWSHVFLSTFSRTGNSCNKLSLRHLVLTLPSFSLCKSREKPAIFCRGFIPRWWHHKWWMQGTGTRGRYTFKHQRLNDAPNNTKPTNSWWDCYWPHTAPHQTPPACQNQALLF